MDSKKLLIWGGIAVVALAALFLIMRPAGGGAGAENVSASRAAELAAAGVRVIDVRTPGEFETSHVPGAENVPMDALSTEAAGWDPAEPLLIYCATGARSAQAVQYLEAQGFETIYHLDAGLVAWEGELEKGTQVAPMPPDAVPAGTPVMYEFFTDW